MANEMNVNKLFGDFFNPKRLAAYDIGDLTGKGSADYASLLINILLGGQGNKYITSSGIVSRLNRLFDKENIENAEKLKDLFTVIGVKEQDCFRGPRLEDSKIKPSATITSLMGQHHKELDGQKKFSLILSDAPYVSPAALDTDKVSVFLNSIPSHTLTQCHPYLEVLFEFETFESKRLSSPSTLKFLLGAKDVGSLPLSDQLSFGGTLKKVKPEGEENSSSQEMFIASSGMEMFTSPQTLVPFDNLQAGSSAEDARLVNIRDRFRPYMSIVSVTINVTPMIGFMTYKTAAMKIKLHDRSRLGDLSGLLKAEVMTRTKIWLEYGLKHPINPNDNYAVFINSNMSVREAYGVINSSYTFDDDGGVTIDIELATKFSKEMTQLRLHEVGLESNNVLRSWTIIRKYANQLVQIYNRSYKKGSSSGRPDPRIVSTLNEFSSGKFPAINKQTSAEIIRLAKILMRDNSMSGPQLSSDDQLKLLKALQTAEGVSSKASKEKGIDVKKAISDFLSQNISGLSEGDDVFLTLYNKYTVKSIVEKVNQNATSSKLKESDLQTNKEYVSFGKLLTRVAFPSFVKIPAKEIQVYFYAFNEKAGPVGRMNISQFPIHINSFLGDWSKHIIETGKDIATLSIEEFISLVVDSQLNDPAAKPYGTKGFYKWNPEDLKHEIKGTTSTTGNYRNRDSQNKAKAVDNPKTEDSANKIANDAASKVQKELKNKKIPSTAERSKKSELDSNKEGLEKVNDNYRDAYGIFNKPALEMYIETLHAETGKIIANSNNPEGLYGSSSQDKTIDEFRDTIVRIHIYDKQNDPFPLAKSLMVMDDGEIAAVDQEKINKTVSTLVKNGALPTLTEGTIANDPSSYTKKIGVKANDFESIKNYLSQGIPYIRYGVNGTAIKTANLSTMNDELLKAIQMTTNSNSKNNTSPNNSNYGGIPLRVIPSKLSMTMMGCPLVRCAQTFFIDFQTGTTIDNTYIINSLTHNIGPGTFNTSVEATPMDAYASFQGMFAEKVHEQVKAAFDAKQNEIDANGGSATSSKKPGKISSNINANDFLARLARGKG